MPKFPDGWFDYSSVGKVIEGTRIITFKVPLKEAFFTNNRNVQDTSKFTPAMLVEEMQSRGLNLGLVIDLTFTNRYYDAQEFESQGIQYEKILVPGHVIPDQQILDKFYEAIDRFLESSDKDSVVGVHCTHGVNRTGYIVCRYMVEHLGMKATEALEAYSRARGYPVERLNYIHDLKMRAGEEYDEEALKSREKEGQKGSHHNDSNLDKRIDSRYSSDGFSQLPSGRNHSQPVYSLDEGQGQSGGQGHLSVQSNTIGSGLWSSLGPIKYDYQAGFDWFDNPPATIPDFISRSDKGEYVGNNHRSRARGHGFPHHGRREYWNQNWGQGYQDDEYCQVKNHRDQGYCDSAYHRNRQWNRNGNNSYRQGYDEGWNRGGGRNGRNDRSWKRDSESNQSYKSSHIYSVPQKLQNYYDTCDKEAGDRFKSNTGFEWKRHHPYDRKCST